MSHRLTLARVAEIVGGEVRGEPGDAASVSIERVATIKAACATDITWATHRRLRDDLRKSKAAAVLVGRDFGPTPMPAVVCAHVDHAMATLMTALGPPLPGPPVGVDPTARVSPQAEIGSGVAIGPNVVIEAGARIGNNTILHAGVYVGHDSRVGADGRLWNNVVVREHCHLGDRVVIQPNAVIGADGFGYYVHEGRHRHIPHIGRVIIGDDVEIGASSCVDRSKTGDTIVGSGTKIDNLVQIAHNVVIGENCLLCAQVGVAGSAELGQYVVLGGHVGIRDNIKLHDGVMVGACSCVPQDVPAGSKVTGIPATESRQFLREHATLRKLPDLLSQVRALAERVKSLEAAANDQPHS